MLSCASLSQLGSMFGHYTDSSIQSHALPMQVNQSLGNFRVCLRNQRINQVRVFCAINGVILCAVILDYVAKKVMSPVFYEIQDECGIIKKAHIKDLKHYLSINPDLTKNLFHGLGMKDKIPKFRPGNDEPNATEDLPGTGTDTTTDQSLSHKKGRHLRITSVFRSHTTSASVVQIGPENSKGAIPRIPSHAKLKRQRRKRKVPAVVFGLETENRVPFEFSPASGQNVKIGIEWQKLEDGNVKRKCDLGNLVTGRQICLGCRSSSHPGLSKFHLEATLTHGMVERFLAFDHFCAQLF